jgi:hypothetical protein
MEDGIWAVGYKKRINAFTLINLTILKIFTLERFREGFFTLARSSSGLGHRSRIIGTGITRWVMKFNFLG